MLRSALQTVGCVFLVCGLSQAVWADEQASSLFGIEVGSTHLDAQDDLERSFTKDVTDIGVRLGARSESYRFLAGYHFIQDFTEKSSDVSSWMATGQIDFLLYHWSLSQAWSVEPYIGMNGGYMGYKYGSLVDEQGFTYGADAGLLFDMQYFDFDIGVRYMGSELQSVNTCLNAYIGIDFKIETN